MMNASLWSDSNFNMSINNSDDAEAAGHPYGIHPDSWAYRVHLNGIFGTFLEIFGIIGNILSIVVLLRYKQKTSTPLLLIFLAFFDSLFLVWEMILEQFTLLSKVEHITPAYRPFITPVYVICFPIPKIAFTGSSMMTVLITIERYIAVVHPLKASTWCNKSVGRKAIACVFVWAVLFNLPRCLAYSYHYKWNPDTNSTKLKFIRTEYGNGSLYNDVYIAWVTLILEFLVPFLVILVLNIRMLVAIKRSRDMVSTRGKDPNTRDGKLTTMVLAVTTLFFCCGLMRVSALILVRGVNKYTEITSSMNNYVAVTDTLLIFNCAFNFILYCCIGKKFRTIFCEVFCCQKKGKQSSIMSSQTKSTSVNNH